MPSSVKGNDKKSSTTAEEKNPPKSETVLAALPHGTSKSVVATLGFEAAILTCKTKVEKIAKECRIANRKYRDFHFDLWLDGRYCLDGLTEENPDLNPAGTLRVEVKYEFTLGEGDLTNDNSMIQEIFENPKFFEDGVSAGEKSWRLFVVSIY